MKLESISKEYQINNLITSLSKTDKLFEFDFDKFNVYDVCDEVINCFDGCKKFTKEDIEKLKEYKILRELSQENNDEFCIDLLGIYKDCNKEKNIIFLAENRIKDCAKKCDIEFENLYNFVKIHELAHGIMSPLASGYDEKSSKNIEDIVVEESLATAYTLKLMKENKNFEKLKKFVNHQPLQYQFGNIVYDNFGESIEFLMILWKLVKITKNQDILHKILLESNLEEFSQCMEFSKILFKEKNKQDSIIFYLILKEIFKDFKDFKNLKEEINKNFEIVIDDEMFKWIYQNCEQNLDCIDFITKNLTIKFILKQELYSITDSFIDDDKKCECIKKFRDYLNTLQEDELRRICPKIVVEDIFIL